MADPSKKKKPAGRYDGDYLTILEHHSTEGRWRVLVFEWHTEEQGYEHGTGWYDPHYMFGDFQPKEFRTLKRALHYRSKIHGAADLVHFGRFAHKQRESGWEATGEWEVPR